MSDDILMRAGDGPLSRTLHSDAIASTIIAGLPSWLDPDQFRRVCVSAFADDALAGVSPREQLRAVLKCAELGILPGASGHIAFIPRGQKLHAEVMFRGYIYLAEQLPHVRKVSAHVVHESDVFEAEEVGPDKWDVRRHGRADGDPFAVREFNYRKGIALAKTGLRGVYVKIEHVDGSISYHVIPGDRVLHNMAASKTDSVSSKYPERFFRKTAIRAAWADGVFTGSNDEIVARGMALRQFDIELDVRPSRPAVAAPSMLTLAAETVADEPTDHDPETGEVTTDVVDLPEYTEDGMLIPAE